MISFVGSYLSCGGDYQRVSLENAADRSPTPENKIEGVETIEKSYVLLETEASSPVRIVDVTIPSTDFHFRQGLDIDIQNRTTKEIFSVQIGFSAPPKCLNYYSAGDTVIDSREKKVLDAQSIRPLSTVSLRMPTDICRAYLSPKPDNHCPPAERKPVIYVWGVVFADGTKWERIHPAT